MKVFNMTVTELRVYEVVIEAESKEEAINTVKNSKIQETDLVDKGIIINEISEMKGFSE